MVCFFSFTEKYEICQPLLLLDRKSQRAESLHKGRGLYVDEKFGNWRLLTCAVRLPWAIPGRAVFCITEICQPYLLLDRKSQRAESLHKGRGLSVDEKFGNWRLLTCAVRLPRTGQFLEGQFFAFSSETVHFRE
jgi:hypothetical protein